MSVYKVNENKTYIIIFIVLIVAFSAYYLLSPKIEEVNEYESKHDIVKLCELFKKTKGTEHQSVFHASLLAIVKLNDEQGNDFLNQYVIASDTEKTLREEIVETFMKYDPKYIERTADKYLSQGTSYETLWVLGINDDVKKTLRLKISRDALKNMTNNYSDLEIIENLKRLNMLAEGNIYVDAEEYVFLWKSLSNIETDFESEKLKEIERKINDNKISLRALEWYFRNGGELIKQEMQRIYMEQGLQSAIDYQQRATKQWFLNIDKYHHINDEIIQLENDKNNIYKEKQKKEWEIKEKKDTIYRKIKAWIQNEKSNIKIEKNISLSVKPLGYFFGMKDTVHGVEFRKVFTNNNTIKLYVCETPRCLEFEDIIPVDKVGVSDNRFIFTKNEGELVQVQIKSYGNFYEIRDYLYNRYGTGETIEGSEKKYLLEWKDNEAVVNLIYLKEENACEIIITERNYFDNLNSDKYRDYFV